MFFFQRFLQKSFKNAHPFLG